MSTNEITGTRESAPKSATRGSEIEIDTDPVDSSHGVASAPRAQMITQTNETGGAARVAASNGAASNGAASNGAASNGGDDDAIAVSDDEIESAEPARPTLTSGLPAFSTRSRPPARPSLPPSQRPRNSSTSLPPPRPSNRAGVLLGSSLPPPSFPSQVPSSERDPWMLANKTLELSRANARITALEDQIAFRDARILTLEERLESAQQRIVELEAKLEQSPAAARPAPKPAATSAKPASTSSKAVSIPKPADMSKPPSSRQPLSAAAAAVFATGPATSANHSPAEQKPAGQKPAAVQTAAVQAAAVQAAAAERVSAKAPTELTPEPPETSESVAPPALVEELAASREPNGPEDLQRIADIGPRFEAALRKQGITRVAQIAAWSEADIRLVAKALKIPKSRIVKGRWVETARELSK